MLFTLTSLKPQTRLLDNTEIEYLANDEKMLKIETENIYKSIGKDTILNHRVKQIKEINELCNELKSDLLNYEIGYKKITPDLKGKK